MCKHESNLRNLVGLWHKYGSQQIEGGTYPHAFTNTGWPNRCWVDWGVWDKETLNQILQESHHIKKFLTYAPVSAVVPIFRNLGTCNTSLENQTQAHTLLEKELLEQHWHCQFEQTAMYLDLSASPAATMRGNDGFQVVPVSQSESLSTWVDIASEAFGYSVDYSVIEPLIDDYDLKILLGYQNATAVACGLLYKTGDVIGLHQFGVKRAFQRKGIAHRFMQQLIAISIHWQGKLMVLQASEAGQPLYCRLGFKEQFLIRNYSR